MNTKVDDLDSAFFDMNHMEPYQKRRRLEGMSLTHVTPQDSLLAASSTTDIWRPYLHPEAESYVTVDPMIQQIKLENALLSDPMLHHQQQQQHEQQQHEQQHLQQQHQQQLQQQQQQENLISFMLKNEDQKLLANMSSGLQLTKL